MSQIWHIKYALQYPGMRRDRKNGRNPVFNDIGGYSPSLIPVLGGTPRLVRFFLVWAAKEKRPAPVWISFLFVPEKPDEYYVAVLFSGFGKYPSYYRVRIIEQDGNSGLEVLSESR